MSKHLKDLAQDILEAFLLEEMEMQDLQKWQLHYEDCEDCRGYIETCDLNQKWTSIGESCYSFFQETPQLLSEQLWEHLEEKLEEKTKVLLRLFREHHLIQEESLELRAAGIASNLMLPEIRLPESFLGDSKSEVLLTFEQDSVSNDLFIGFSGGEAQVRSQINLSIIYLSGEEELLHGKDIMVYGTWTIPAQRVAEIGQMELKFISTL